MALSDKDVDADMAKDWAEIQDKYTPEPVEPPAEKYAPYAKESDQAEEKEVIPVSREADGKFKAQKALDDKAKVKEAKAAPAAAKDSLPEASKEASADVTQEQPQRDVNRPPSTWKPAAREKFAALDPAIKAEIHRREADFLNGQAQLAPDATLGKNLRQVIEPYRHMIEAEGGNYERATADLFRTAAVFRTGTQQQKLQAIAVVADQFNVDLTPLFHAIQARNGGQQQQAAGQQQQQPQVFRDPRVDQLLARENQMRQETAQREQQQTESTVTRWMNEVDATGNPKRPYVGDVINEMSALVPQIKAADPTLTHSQALDAAYDRATWAHPEVRTLLAQKQQTELEAQRRSENQNRVRDAKRAGSVNVPRRGSTPSAGKPGTMEETIAATARELGLFS